MRVFIPILVFVALSAYAALSASARADELIGHEVQLDSSGKIVPWTPFGNVLELGWAGWKRVPKGDHGLPVYYTYPRFDPATLQGIWWAHNPAGLNAMLTLSAIPYYAYSGDQDAIWMARDFLDYHLTHGMTLPTDNWASVPYASAFPGASEYHGGDDTKFCGDGKACGRGDGDGFIEPDKIGEMGYALARFYELTGDKKYLEAAVQCGKELARHVRKGDAFHSPWPFRVDAQTGKKVREEFTANAIGPIQLFDELIKLDTSFLHREAKTYAQARKIAWDWLMAYPIRQNLWSGYFEDIPIHADPTENPNQYVPLETARYLLQHRELDWDWQKHVASILAFVHDTFAVDWEGRFGVEKGVQWGAEVLSEQVDDMAKMGSHTSRYGSVLALWSEVMGDAVARDRAYRSLAWASYTCSPQGVVKVGTNDDEGYWFSDGYGDYLRHFLSAMGSVPEWAPADRDHLLRSTSVVREVKYAEGSLVYRTFDSAGTEVLRVRARPLRVEGAASLDARALPGGGYRVEIRRKDSRETQVIFGK